ncbi:MAG: LuxR C-terminal-related transcriptional regulator, partial [Polyangiaceae bacterium]|nr:LuxR C-terminal-related transcriptional regulator [Polyangiaceae bacterium]
MTKISKKDDAQSPSSIDLPTPSGLRLTQISDDIMILSHELPALSEQRLKNFSQVERELCQLAFEGLSDREIAEKRGRSVRTVTTQLHKLYMKLGLTSRTELIAWLHQK